MSPKVKNTHYYDRERRKGRTVSAILHLLFVVISILGLPSFLSPPPPEEPVSISVEILPITGITNIKPSDKAPAEEVKPDEKKAEQKKPSPPVKTADNTPPPPPEPSPAELQKEKEKAEEIKKQKEEKKKKEKQKKEADDLAAVLKAVQKTAQDDKKDLCTRVGSHFRQKLCATWPRCRRFTWNTSLTDEGCVAYARVNLRTTSNVFLSWERRV